MLMYSADVVVLGAGIVGAATAYRLARAGVAVTLLERAAAPATGATGSSFAWIGEHGGHWPGGAQALRPHVLADHARLEAELPDFVVCRTGSLRWTDDTAGADGITALTAHPGQRIVGRDEIARLEPHLRNPPDRAVHTPTDAGVDAGAMTAALVRAARAHGARVVHGVSGVSITPSSSAGRGVRTSDGFHRATTVVVAAGVESAALCRPLGVEPAVTASPACLLRVAAPPGLIRTIVACPQFEAREVRSGELLLTMPYTDGRSADSVARAARRTLDRLIAHVDDGSACRLLGFSVAQRPMPLHGPIVGHVTADRSVYVAVMHSAVTLAPTVARLIAAELTTGKPADELRNCRP
jgi:glycine/D-amino acid oxidase-like deaminating enzyme